MGDEGMEGDKREIWQRNNGTIDEDSN